MSSIAIGSLFSGILCLGLSIAPIPFQRYAMLRCAGAVGAIGSFAIGHRKAQTQKKLQAEFDRIRKIEEQREQELDELERKNREAIEAGKREALVIEARRKEEARIEVAVADYADDVRDAYVVVQDEKGRLDRVLDRLQSQPEPEPEQIALPGLEISEPETQPETKEKIESLAAKKAKLLKLINEHEGGWIGQCMKKPILIYGDQGSGKSYFAEFLALCRHYLRGHQIVSIADPHFHQNHDECWKQLVKLGVPGFGAHHNYQEVNSQILAMYDRFTRRTLKDVPITSIFDEVTRYSKEENTQEAANQLGSKLSSDPRKAKESPILIAHAKTLAALGGGEGFAEAIQGNFIRIKLNSDSEQEPLWRGTISGIKDEDGESIENQKISIAPDWIRSSWVYELFNSKAETPDSTETKPDLEPEKTQSLATANKAEFLEQARKWLQDVYEVEAEVTSLTTPWDEAPEVVSEVPEVRNSNTYAIASLLPEDVRSKAMTRILTLLGEAESASDEVIRLMPAEPDRAVQVGIKLLGKSMTAVSRDIFGMGTGGAKFKIAKAWYETLKKEFE